jgi:hypothetical protein
MNLPLIKESLNSSQKAILEKFISHFFVPTGNKRNYRTNEIEYVYTVFNKIFKKHFEFTPNQVDILKAFQNSGIKIYKRTGLIEGSVLHFNKGKIEEVNVFNLPERVRTEHHFIEISPLVVKALSRMYMNLPQLKDQDIIKEIKEYEGKFEEFLKLFNLESNKK